MTRGGECGKVNSVGSKVTVKAKVAGIQKGMGKKLYLFSVDANVKENAKLKNVGDPEGSQTPTSPNVTRNTIIAFLGGLILALIISFVRDFLDVKIKYNEEMIPILAAIPDFEYFSNQKNANKYGNRYGK